MRHYSKIAKSFSMLVLALILANSSNSYSQIIVKQAQAASNAIIPLNSDSNKATITKVQLPGVLPNNNENNNNNNPSTLTPISPPTNPSANNNNNNNQGPATTTTAIVPPIVHRNTRAR